MARAKESDADRRREVLAAEAVLATPAPGGDGELYAAACYPNSYRVGMASLGYQLAWGAFAAHPAFRAERYFACYAGKPPKGVVKDAAGLEYGTPLSRAGVVAFSVYYEPDYQRVYGMLAGGGVRPWAGERGEFDPFVILGGPAVTANPEPLAPFADAVVLGDAEESLPAVLDVVAANVGGPRRDVLALMAHVPGVYVPALYRVLYGAPGSPAQVVPEEGAPAKAEASRVDDLTPYRGGSWLATPHAEFGKLLLLEPVRGCGRSCSFCQTGAISSPPRRRELSSLWPLVDEARDKVGKVGLVGAALADYGDVVELAQGVVERGMLLSVSSLALAAPRTPAVLQALGASGQRGVALAPEAATAEMQARLGKALPPGRLEECLDAAAAAGLSKIKLYYIVGAPGESAADVAAVGDELARLNRRYKTLTFQARVNPLVPKPRTPLADAPLISRREFRDRVRAIRARARGVRVRAGSWREAELQRDLGRGSRALSRWVARAADRGA
ncbi:MAG TPA: radical SAM protein [bacterium]|nr:radical SAM protein [bacterium]